MISYGSDNKQYYDQIGHSISIHLTIFKKQHVTVVMSKFSYIMACQAISTVKII